MEWARNDNSRYNEKTTKNDIRQSVEYDKFGKEPRMSQKCEICVEIRVVKFPLMFPRHPQYCQSNISNSRCPEKTTKNDFQQSVESTKFGKELEGDINVKFE